MIRLGTANTPLQHWKFLTGRSIMTMVMTMVI